MDTIFWGLLVELIVFLVAWQFKQDRDRFLVLLAGTIIAGLIAFNFWPFIVPGETAAESRPPTTEVEPSPIPSPAMTLTPTKDRPTAIPTPPPSPTTTAVPEIVEFENPSVSIVVHDNRGNSGEGLVRFRILVAGNPQRDTMFRIWPVTKDIAGEWSLAENTNLGTSYTHQSTDSNGTLEQVLPSGMYAIIDDEGRTIKRCDKLGGTWGIQGFDGNDREEMIVFPIYAGKITEVAVSLGLLEVALLSSDGSAVKDHLVYVYPQIYDVASQPMKSEDYLNEICDTGATGLATFALGQGTYVVDIPRRNSWPESTFDVNVVAGQIHRETIIKQ